VLIVRKKGNVIGGYLDCLRKGYYLESF
jgi:hypothetical protein